MIHGTIAAVSTRKDMSDKVCLNSKAVRMGQHVWLLLATVGTEMLVIIKWSQGQFPEPLPNRVKWAWETGGVLLVLYPIVRVGRTARCSAGI